MKENIDYLKKLTKKTTLMQEFPKYVNKDLNFFSKETKTKIAIHLSAYLACKLEQFAVKKGILIGDLIKKLLIEKNILNEEDISFSKKRKFIGFYDGKNCEDLKGSGAYKTYNINLSEYAKAKLYKYLYENDYQELSFFFIKNLTKGIAPEGFEIFEPKDIVF